jgi:hypothetical protein
MYYYRVKIKISWVLISSNYKNYISYLIHLQLPWMNRDRCNELYGQGSITEAMVCAGKELGGVDSCQVLVCMCMYLCLCVGLCACVYMCVLICVYLHVCVLDPKSIFTPSLKKNPNLCILHIFLTTYAIISKRHIFINSEMRNPKNIISKSRNKRKTS